MSIIKVNPLADFGLEEESRVVFAIVTDHAHQVELRLFGLVLCHSVEQLRVKRRRRGCLLLIHTYTFTYTHIKVDAHKPYTF